LLADETSPSWPRVVLAWVVLFALMGAVGLAVARLTRDHRRWNTRYRAYLEKHMDNYEKADEFAADYKSHYKRQEELLTRIAESLDALTRATLKNSQG
jgi:hypothetical protein